MLDVNKEVRDILNTLDNVKVTFYHPEVFNVMPVISYYELATTTGMCYDNAEQAQASSVVIDIWGKSGGECARLAIRVDEAMQKNRWRREISTDLPPEEKIYHKSMRYSKEIYY